MDFIGAVSRVITQTTFREIENDNSLVTHVDENKTVKSEDRKVYLTGNFQTALGNTNNWVPGAKISQMQYIGNNLYTFTAKFPKGRYEYKIAIDGTWNENYGLGGKYYGNNVPFYVEEDNQKVMFYYNDETHMLTDSTRYTALSENDLPRISGELGAYAEDPKLQDFNFDHFYSICLDLPQGNFSGVLNFDGLEFPIEVKLTDKGTVSIYYDRTADRLIIDDGAINSSTIRHDTFNIENRNPFHPVTSGEEITLNVQVDRDIASQIMVQVFKAEIRKDELMYDDMITEMPLKVFANVDGQKELWQSKLIINEPGLYGYKFIINDGEKEYGDDITQGGIGEVVVRNAKPFPITVYDKNYHTPRWFKESIVYQIFTDRFSNGNNNNDLNLPPKAQHNQWNEVAELNERNNTVFYGGDIEGIIQKLDYLQELGVTAIYLNPIFEANTNHGYNVANYGNISSFYGGDVAFRYLVDELKSRDMHLIMDGVFNHTGTDSIYFDMYSKYHWVGAYEYWTQVYNNVNSGLSLAKSEEKAHLELLQQGQKFSPYNWHLWFDIHNDKNEAGLYKYTTWEGASDIAIFSEPSNNVLVNYPSEVNNLERTYYLLDEIAIKYLMEKGVSGWRLDSAGEVDPAFWRMFRSAVKSCSLLNGEEPVIIGEVWRNSVNTSAFFLGDKFDSVTNYVLRGAIVDSFLINGDAKLADYHLTLMRQSYPPEALQAEMNVLSTHDTARTIYLLGGGSDNENNIAANPGENFDLKLGVERMKLASMFQMTYVGTPTIYYGDEVGLYGGRDPDNRRTFPWGKENQELTNYYKKLISLRNDNQHLFVYGETKALYAKSGVYIYARITENDEYAIIALNRDGEPQKVEINVPEWINNNSGNRINHFPENGDFVIKDDKISFNLKASSGFIVIN